MKNFKIHRLLLLSLVLLFIVGSVFSQEVFKPGMVKGKHVTYEVRKQKGRSPARLIRNVHNPDTVIKTVPNPGRVFHQVTDIKMQVVEILHEHLSPEELLKIEITEHFGLVLRVDREKYKLLQVTCFSFSNLYLAGRKKSPEERQEMRLPDSYDGFWLNLDPDRLHAIEKDIVKRVVLPTKMPEMFLTDDFQIIVTRDMLLSDIDKVKEERMKAIELWKKYDLKPIKGFPPTVL